MSSYTEPKIKVFKSNSDFSAKQFHFAKLASGTNVAQSGAAEKAIGVVMNKPAINDDAEVAHLGGGALLKLAATIAAGDSIASDANGAGVLGTSGQWCPAVAMEAGISGDVVSVILNGHQAI
jgi:hypothetical protein